MHRALMICCPETRRRAGRARRVLDLLRTCVATSQALPSSRTEVGSGTVGGCVVGVKTVTPVRLPFPIFEGSRDQIGERWIAALDGDDIQNSPLHL
jgi:hypothetical protein